jgi:hypothetical protein
MAGNTSHTSTPLHSNTPCSGMFFRPREGFDRRPLLLGQGGRRAAGKTKNTAKVIESQQHKMALEAQDELTCRESFGPPHCPTLRRCTP